ncbi:riboflavin biosynthesis protein RibF [bacterium]|nr:riboflavin biosynthesis protein RibF [bacterium]MBQ9149629.1 riboflavin biosynthesis protein RibF [bacterium]
MEILHEISPNKKLAIALGYFDGIHIGHKKIINTLVQQARAKGVKSAIITFDKNPADYFSEKQTLGIQTFKDRQLILNSLGVDYLYELNFEQFKELSAMNYLEEVLIKNFEPEIIVVGYNHTFGKDKTGSPALLKEFSSKYNYDCIIVPEQKYQDKEEVSSTIIRKRIEYGHLNAVKALLGRQFSVRNSVVKGNKIARTLGYPTANLVWPNSMVKLPYGVYHGYVQTGSKMKPALISWGTKPTLTNGKNEILEAHLYDFNENLYGKIIKVIFVKKMRDEQNFGNIRVLATQLQKDYEAFKKWAQLMIR